MQNNAFLGGFGMNRLDAVAFNPESGQTGWKLSFLVGCSSMRPGSQW